MRAHLVQLDIRWEDRTANHSRAEGLIAGAAPAAGDLVVLPEMFDTGFSFHLAVTADRDGLTLAWLRRIARTHRVYLHGSRTLVSPDGLGLNLTTVCAPDGVVICEYTKVHRFSLGAPGRREVDHFAAGAGVTTYPWTNDAGGRSPEREAERLLVCPAICYDLRFPELFRAGLAQGAELFVVPANWPAARVHHWRTLLVARAIENQAWVIGVNRAGNDPTPLEYPGASLVVDPRGEVIAEADAGEQVLSVELDPRGLRSWREKFPAWREAPTSINP